MAVLIAITLQPGQRKSHTDHERGDAILKMISDLFKDDVQKKAKCCV